MHGIVLRDARSKRSLVWSPRRLLTKHDFPTIHPTSIWGSMLSDAERVDRSTLLIFSITTCLDGRSWSGKGSARKCGWGVGHYPLTGFWWLLLVSGRRGTWTSPSPGPLM